MYTNIRVDEYGNSEEWFFQLLFSDDIWTNLKFWIRQSHPNKRFSNWYNYRNGNIVIHYNYLSLMKSKTLDYGRLDIHDLIAIMKRGDLEMIKFIYSVGIRTWSRITIKYAAKYGQLDIIKFLYTNYKLGWTRDAIDWAAENGHLDTVKWLHETEKCRPYQVLRRTDI